MSSVIVAATQNDEQPYSWFALPCAAIDEKRCLAVSCHGQTRVVEVHRVGIGIDGAPLLSGWQIEGPGDERAGWKLIKIDAETKFTLTHLPSKAPRRDYRPGARRFIGIIAQV